MSVKKSSLFLSLCVMGMALLCLGAPLMAHDAPAPPKSNNLKIGVVDFKVVIEDSKLGKREQGNFDALKKQMETVLEEREKATNEIAAKFNDPDYMDGLSEDAERELKHKYRTMGQEFNQIQTQYYQTLNQANMKILQDINDIVAESASQVAKDGKFDVILNDEECFYFSNALDITKDVVAVMDKKFDAESKK